MTGLYIRWWTKESLSSLTYLCLFTQKGTYLPQTYIVREEMMVTGRIRNLRQLGPFIHRLCYGKETYKLKRRSARRRKYKFSHFPFLLLFSFESGIKKMWKMFPWNIARLDMARVGWYHFESGGYKWEKVYLLLSGDTLTRNPTHEVCVRQPGFHPAGCSRRSVGRAPFPTHA